MRNLYNSFGGCNLLHFNELGKDDVAVVDKNKSF